MDAEEQSTLTPDRWEDFAVFRETFLTLYMPPETIDAWRVVGRQIYLQTLELPSYDRVDVTATRSEIRAGIRDLRQLQGFFATVGRSYRESQLGADSIRLAQLAEKLAPQLGSIADGLEVALA